jgi:hypothetical protein
LERSLLLGSLALGLVGWLAGLLLSRTSPRAGARALRRGLVIGAVFVIVVAVKAAAARAMWPSAFPWEVGIALGGVAALLGAWTLLRLNGVDAGLSRGAVVAAPMFLAVAASAAAAVWLRSTLVETLLGVAFGWLTVAVAAYADTFAQAASGAEDTTVSTGAIAALMPNLGFALTLPAAVALATFRDAAAQATTWTVSLILLAVGVPLAVVLVSAGTLRGGEARGTDRGLGAIAVIIASLALGGFAALIGLKVLGQPRFPVAAAAGLLTSLVLWWLSAETAGESTRHPATGLPSGSHALSALMALAGIVAAFYALVGYGVGVAMLAAWLPVAVAVATGVAVAAGRQTAGRDRAATRAGTLLILGLIILVYRVFVQRFDADLTGTSLTDHFAIFAFVAGLVVPGLLGRVLASPAAGAGRLVVQLVAVYALMALVPATALALWGVRAAIGLLAGFAASTVIYPEAPASAGVAAGISLLLAQWGRYAAAVAALTRDDRIKILVALAAVTAIVLMLADVSARSSGRTTEADTAGRSTKGAPS